MNDRFRNLMKAHDHIVKGRSKEVRKVFIPHWGYVFVSNNGGNRYNTRSNIPINLIKDILKVCEEHINS